MNASYHHPQFWNIWIKNESCSKSYSLTLSQMHSVEYKWCQGLMYVLSWFKSSQILNLTVHSHSRHISSTLSTPEEMWCSATCRVFWFIGKNLCSSLVKWLWVFHYSIPVHSTSTSMHARCYSVRRALVTRAPASHPMNAALGCTYSVTSTVVP